MSEQTKLDAEPIEPKAAIQPAEAPSSPSGKNGGSIDKPPIDPEAAIQPAKPHH
jgi:hypothetical protein